VCTAVGLSGGRGTMLCGRVRRGRRVVGGGRLGCVLGGAGQRETGRSAQGKEGGSTKRSGPAGHGDTSSTCNSRCGLFRWIVNTGINLSGSRLQRRPFSFNRFIGGRFKGSARRKLHVGRGHCCEQLFRQGQVFLQHRQIFFSKATQLAVIKKYRFLK